MKAILMALYPTAMFGLGIFLGRRTGRLDGKILLCDRVKAALLELRRLPRRDEKELRYVQGYFHGICHVSDGKPPDAFQVDALISELE